MNREQALKEWCTEHYQDFGFYPPEFEYENKLYKIVLPDFTLEEIKDETISQ